VGVISGLVQFGLDYNVVNLYTTYVSRINSKLGIWLILTEYIYVFLRLLNRLDRRKM
jgi:hypothetical protein